MRDFAAAVRRNMRAGSRAQPMAVVVRESLTRRVRELGGVLGRQLTRMLWDEYGLASHLHALRALFLLAAGAQWHDFVVTFFARMDAGESMSAHDVNSAFSEALSHWTLGDDAVQAAVSASAFEAKGSLDGTSVEELSGLLLTYPVDAPLDIVLHAEAMAKYNRVMVFLLQLKRCKVLLERTRSTRAARPRPDLHRINLLRHELLNLVNNLHFYAMARVLHQLWDEYLPRMRATLRLDDLRKLHDEYLDAACERCLLHKRGELVMGAIRKILNLCIRFAAVVAARNAHERRKLRRDGVVDPELGSGDEADGDEDAPSDADDDDDGAADGDVEAQLGAKFDKIDVEFRKYSKFLLTILAKTCERGTHPHLEDLHIRLAFNERPPRQ